MTEAFYISKSFQRNMKTNRAPKKLNYQWLTEGCGQIKKPGRVCWLKKMKVCEAALGQMPAWPDSSEQLLLAGNQIEGRVIYISCTTPQAVEAGSI